MSDSPFVDIPRLSFALPAHALDHRAWEAARPLPLTHYWSGAEAPPARHAEARLLAHAAGLSARFICRQREPLVVAANPQTETKTIGLWERDVCELFVAPEAGDATHYYEFEAAPTGEWLDLAIRRQPDGRATNWDYSSGMSVPETRADDEQVSLCFTVPWAAFGPAGPPPSGARWRGNLYRCVGRAPARGYLSWRPTHTPAPDFHVPEAFGWFVFE